MKHVINLLKQTIIGTIIAAIAIAAVVGIIYVGSFIILYHPIIILIIVMIFVGVGDRERNNRIIIKPSKQLT